MSKLSTLMSTLLLSTSAFVATVSFAGCEDIVAQDECNFLCRWDVQENRCEAVIDLCHLVHNPNRCNAFDACAWDNTEGRCEQK